MPEDYRTMTQHFQWRDTDKQPVVSKVVSNRFTDLARLLKKLNARKTEQIDMPLVIAQIEEILHGSELELRFDSEYDEYSLREKL